MPRSGIVQPDIFSYKESQSVFVYGEAVVSRGLEVRDATNGFGAVSFGLLWELQAIWLDTEYVAPITTTWSNVPGASITTTWSPVQYGLWGEYTP